MEDLKCRPHIDNLPKDHVTRYKAVPKTRIATIMQKQDKWLIIGDDYPAQITERMRLLSERPDYYLDHLPGSEIAAAEIELRDAVVDYMTSTYSDYFYRNGNSVVCRLTGISIRLNEADPRVVVALMAAEDFGILLPSDKPDITGEKNYRLSSGILIQPSGWSLTSKFNIEAPYDETAHQLSLDNARLGKTSYEIHTSRVSHYAKHFADKVERFYRNMNPGVNFWRRNWGPYRTAQLSLHPDLPRAEKDLQTPEDWRSHGVIRSEHEGFMKLPGSKAVIFSIRTFLWKVSDIEKNKEALEALVTAYDNLSPEMYDYRRDRLDSFGRYIDSVRHRIAPVPWAEQDRLEQA
ncbi:MAG: DUF3445 domain-containing protein [Alphaproteobacteria bacterium]|nr:DUF3445 domain-containing protein [Alphaproteobacteria bacterium]